MGRLLHDALLVTLTGPAGVGKSRLALEIAGQAQRGRRFEAAVVRLRQVTDAIELRQRVMRTLDGLTSATAQHGSGPGNTSHLLVLDDCEHILDECGLLLGQLLPLRGPLKVLATSREPLRLPGEAVFSVTGLATPLGDGHAALAGCLRSYAVRLFLDRARAVVPGFQLTEANAAQIGEICRRLDGLPLPIEMAARLTGVFPLSEIVARLDDPLSLLTSGWRLADDRHQSLRASLEWGYDLLSPPEQSLFRKLSVLPGGFGADEAATLVGHADEASDVPDLLVALRAKSLIVPCAEQDGPARFRLLECIRSHGHERLVAEKEDTAAYERMTAWLTTLSAPLQEQAVVHPATLRRLAEERGNLEHLLRRLDDDTDERQHLLAGALAAVELSRGPSEDAAQLVSDVLSRTPEASRYSSIALEGMAAFAAWRGDLGTALRHSGRAVEVERGYDRHPLLGRLLLLRSALLAMANEREDAVTDLKERFRISHHLHDETLTALCRSGLAWHQLQDGDLRSAERTIAEALPLLRTRIPPRQLRMTLVTAGMVALEQGDLPAAEAYFAESLRSCTDHLREAVVAIEGLAVTAARAYQFGKGLQLIEAATRIGGGTSWGGSWWRERIQTARAAALKGLTTSRVDAALTAGKLMRHRHVLSIALGSESNGTPIGTAVDTPLSRREQDVVTLVVQGLSNRQMAARMHVSVRTVETHLRHIRTTLGLRSRAHIAAWAAERQIARASSIA
ncbi:MULTISPECIES: ATP-binding protein [Streptomyces]|uniref:ATP-binding protein n=1 Tax=Streptomyces lycopersici TaxID=2974589 RepID=UPI0021CFBCFB|nr:LuxR C-terminal-related transcriptional regulator [Streptomyces sp. NEAU-383]